MSTTRTAEETRRLEEELQAAEAALDADTERFNQLTSPVRDKQKKLTQHQHALDVAKSDEQKAKEQETIVRLRSEITLFRQSNEYVNLQQQVKVDQQKVIACRKALNNPATNPGSPSFDTRFKK